MNEEPNKCTNVDGEPIKIFGYEPFYKHRALVILRNNDGQMILHDEFTNMVKSLVFHLEGRKMAVVVRMSYGEPGRGSNYAELKCQIKDAKSVAIVWLTPEGFERMSETFSIERFRVSSGGMGYDTAEEATFMCELECGEGVLSFRNQGGIEE